VLAAAGGADAVVMAAAPSDFRPKERSGHKIKKRADGVAPDLALVQNPDILAGLVRARAAAAAEATQVLVGFAAETGDREGDVQAHARAKLRRKGCDVLVVNDVSGGRVFGEDHNAALIMSADGTTQAVPDGPKIALAHVVWDRVVAVWDARD
jgi:phosphopantothenoylcysteine decarboxylase / phosphopantothenate---cysteine ligase